MSQLQQVARDVFGCVAALHERGIRHGDVKPKNIVRRDQRYTLIDLDMSALLGAPASAVEDSKLLGSSAYLPPELVDHATKKLCIADDAVGLLRTETWDLWGLGCTVFEVASGGEPLFAKGMQQDGNGVDELKPSAQATLADLQAGQTRFSQMADKIAAIRAYRSPEETEVIVDFIDWLLEPAVAHAADGGAGAQPRPAEPDERALEGRGAGRRPRRPPRLRAAVRLAPEFPR